MSPTCQRVGCNRPAAYAPKLCVPALRGPKLARLSPVLTLLTCGVCIGELTADDFVAPGDPGRDYLRASLGIAAGGRFAPDFAGAWLEPVPLTSPEWLAAEQARAGARLQ